MARSHCFLLLALVTLASKSAFSAIMTSCSVGFLPLAAKSSRMVLPALPSPSAAAAAAAAPSTAASAAAVAAPAIAAPDPPPSSGERAASVAP